MQCLLSALPQITNNLHTQETVLRDIIDAWPLVFSLHEMLIIIHIVAPLIYAPLSLSSLLHLSLVLFTLGSIDIRLSKTVTQLAGTLRTLGAGSLIAWSLGMPVVAGTTAQKSEPRVWLCESSTSILEMIQRFYTLGYIGGAMSPSIRGIIHGMLVTS